MEKERAEMGEFVWRHLLIEAHTICLGVIVYNEWTEKWECMGCERKWSRDPRPSLSPPSTAAKSSCTSCRVEREKNGENRHPV